MVRSFPEEVRRALDGLIQREDLRVVEEEVANSFDNAEVVLRGDEIRVRIVRERGQVFVDLRPSFGPTEWVDSAHVRWLLTGVEPGTAEWKLPDLAAWLESNLHELGSRFSASKYRQTLTELRWLREESARRRFDP